MKNITLFDGSEYDEHRCHNGGAYSYETEYMLQPNGLYEVTYSTSSDFSYCPYCGSFIGCNDDHSDCDPTYVTAAEVIADIEDFHILYADNKDNCYVLVDGELLDNPFPTPVKSSLEIDDEDIIFYDDEAAN